MPNPEAKESNKIQGDKLENVVERVTGDADRRKRASSGRDDESTRDKDDAAEPEVDEIEDEDEDFDDEDDDDQ